MSDELKGQINSIDNGPRLGKCEQCGKPFTPRTPEELEALSSIPWWDDIVDDKSVPSFCDACLHDDAMLDETTGCMKTNMTDHEAYQLGYEQFTVQMASYLTDPDSEEELVQPGADWVWYEGLYDDEDDEVHIISVGFVCYIPPEINADVELAGAYTNGFTSAARSKASDDKLEAWQLAEDERLANMGDDDDDDDDGGILVQAAAV
jgi:hypothetical protein